MRLWLDPWGIAARVGACVVAVAAGLAIAALIWRDEAPKPKPGAATQKPVAVALGDAKLPLPDGWTLDPLQNASLPGVPTAEGSALIGPASRASVVVAEPAAGFPLPAATEEALGSLADDYEIERIPSLSAFQWELGASDQASAGELLAVLTPNRTIALHCHGSQPQLVRDDCRALLEALHPPSSGTLPASPRTLFVTQLERAMGTLNASLPSLRQKLAKAQTVVGRNDAALAVAKLADTEVDGLSDAADGSKAADATVAALRAFVAGHERLASAIRSRERDTYIRAADSLRAADAAFREALEQWSVADST